MRLQCEATTWCAHPVSHLVLPVVAPYVLEVLAKHELPILTHLQCHNNNNI